MTHIGVFVQAICEISKLEITEIFTKRKMDEQIVLSNKIFSKLKRNELKHSRNMHESQKALCWAKE